MIWNLSCRKTSRLLALRAGDDLEERDWSGAQRHLAVCPRCRETWQRLSQSQQVLEQVRPATVIGSEPERSVWPNVARHIRVVHEQAAAPSWRGWLPAGALAAACLAVVMVALPEPPFGTETANTGAPAVIFTQPAIDMGSAAGAFGSDAGDVRRVPLNLRPDGDGVAPERGRGRAMPAENRDDQRSF